MGPSRHRRSRVNRLALASALVVFVAAAPAFADERFDSLKDRSQKLDSLSGFVSKFVGNCQPYEAACIANLRETRAGYSGKNLLVTLGERATELMKVEANGSSFRIL